MTMYLLFSSDIWKSTSSSNCVLVTTSIDKMQKGIALAIEKNIIEYSRGEQNLTIEEQILMFKKDCKENPEVVWDNLEYGYVEVREEGILEC